MLLDFPNHIMIKTYRKDYIVLIHKSLSIEIIFTPEKLHTTTKFYNRHFMGSYGYRSEKYTYIKVFSDRISIFNNTDMSLVERISFNYVYEFRDKYVFLTLDTLRFSDTYNCSVNIAAGKVYCNSNYVVNDYQGLLTLYDIDGKELISILSEKYSFNGQVPGKTQVYVKDNKFIINDKVMILPPKKDSKCIIT